MRYRLRTLMIVVPLLGIAFPFIAFPAAWQIMATNPDIQFPWLANYSLFAFSAGVIGLVSWAVLAIGSS